MITNNVIGWKIKIFRTEKLVLMLFENLKNWGSGD